MVKMNHSHQQPLTRLGPRKSVSENRGHGCQHLCPPAPPHDLGDVQQHLRMERKRKRKKNVLGSKCESDLGG